MPRKSSQAEQPLLALLNDSERPIYAVDAERRIIYCNAALATWADLPRNRVVGRLVEYHSEPPTAEDAARDSAGPLTGLCPPPAALAGERTLGTVSCVSRDGRLSHRRAEFVPLQAGSPSVLAFLSTADLSPADLAAELSVDSTSDELHRAIRRFRRGQGSRYAIESLLGDSPAMRKVRAQVAAAAASTANVLICGRAGTGRSHVARAIHYHFYDAEAEAARLLPIDGRVATEDSLRRAMDSVVVKAAGAKRATILLEQVERLPAPLQNFVVDLLNRKAIAARIIATTDGTPIPETTPANGEPMTTVLVPALRNLLSTIEIQLPQLVERLDDLPLLAQFFLETSNRDKAKQIGSVRADALDLLAVYSWPGELNQLRDVIAAAHAAATTAAICPADLPPVIHHAAKAAATQRRPRERVVLDELLAKIEIEAITRALAQAGGNKSEAAELLGMTRPRLYRRLVQLNLATPEAREAVPHFEPLPDFREIDAEEPAE